MVKPSVERTEPAAGSPERHTLCGEPAAEARTAQDLARLGTGIDAESGDALAALWLVGPFARGEGGIVYRDGEACAADPGYDLLALVRRRPERQQRALATMAATWGRLLRTQVTIGAVAARDLAHVPATRFWFHASHGQIVTLAGSPRLADRISQRAAALLRGDEAAVALCEGLGALALATLDPSTSSALAIDSMHRAVLACVDAVLLQRGRYEDTLLGRNRALQSARITPALCTAHRDAIQFCSRPDLWTPQDGNDARDWLEHTRGSLRDIYLGLEADRVGAERHVLAYLHHPKPLLVEPRTLLPARVARIARAISLESPRMAAWLVQPLERLLRCSVALAFAPRAPACRRHAARLLRVPIDANGEASDATLARGLRVLYATTLDRGLDDPFALARVAYASSFGASHKP